MRSNREIKILAALGGTIKKVRLSRQMSQKQLGELCNIQKSNMSRIESGKSNLTVSTIYIIALALDVEVNELLAKDFT